ncbi:hypothetical protein VKT23_009950 [Stygiomarasmius scandens]|uniref:Uncharacterized protein n=1 Tax=Marasmiellus scandens TaxID=2682957 RepID=A0ABR1JGP9_9AGAR
MSPPSTPTAPPNPTAEAPTNPTMPLLPSSHSSESTSSSAGDSSIIIDGTADGRPGPTSVTSTDQFSGLSTTISLSSSIQAQASSIEEATPDQSKHEPNLKLVLIPISTFATLLAIIIIAFFIFRRWKLKKRQQGFIDRNHDLLNGRSSNNKSVPEELPDFASLTLPRQSNVLRSMLSQLPGNDYSAMVEENLRVRPYTLKYDSVNRHIPSLSPFLASNSDPSSVVTGEQDSGAVTASEPWFNTRNQSGAPDAIHNLQRRPFSIDSASGPETRTLAMVFTLRRHIQRLEARLNSDIPSVSASSGPPPTYHT